MGVLSLIARITLDSTAFHSGVGGVRRAIQGVAGSVKGQLAGVLSVGALINESRKLIEYGSQINDTAEKIGVSTDRLQELNYAAKQTGSTLESVANAFKNLKKNRLEALQNPAGEQAQAFAALGVNPRGTDINQMFTQIGEAVRKVNFGAGEEPLIEKLLGKSAVELIPMFHEGMEQLAEDARNLGIVLDNETITKLDDVGDSLDRLQFQVRGPLAQAFKVVADIVLGIKMAVSGTLAAVASMVEKFKEIGAAQIGKDLLKALVSPLVPGGMFTALPKAAGHFKEIAKAGGEAFANEADEIFREDEQAKFDRNEARRKKREAFDARPARAFEFARKELAPLSDSLAAVGNFLGADPNRGVIDRLSRIQEHLREIERNTRTPQSGPMFPL